MEEKKKLPPFVDWLLSVGIVLLVVLGVGYVLFTKGVADDLAKKVFTAKGFIVFIVVFLIIGSIREGIQRKKIAKVKKEIQAKMKEDWERPI